MLLQLTRATRVDGKYTASVPVYVNPAHVVLVEHHSDSAVSWVTLSVSQDEGGGESVNFPVMGLPDDIAGRVGVLI